MKLNDDELRSIEGEKNGRILIIKYLGKYLKDNKNTHWYKCSCECNPTKKLILTRNQCFGKSKISSCGCLKKEIAKNINYNTGLKKNNKKFYYAWQNMKKRCLNKNSEHYNRYGGRGITICEKWMAINGFAEDMLESYKDGLTLDRIDNDMGYYKDNCRWVSMKEQCRNRSTNRYVEINGVVKLLSDWSEEYDIPISTIWCRINAGDTDEKIIRK